MKKAFTSFYNKQSFGMAHMLQELSLPLIGKHHSGIDDCKNIARVVGKMQTDGCVWQVTTTRAAHKKK